MQDNIEEDPTMLFFSSLLEGIEKVGFLPKEIHVTKPEVKCLVYELCERFDIELVPTGFMEETENFKTELLDSIMGGFPS